MTTAILTIEQTEAQELAIEEATLARAQQAISEIQSRRRQRQRDADVALLGELRAELNERTEFYQSSLPVFHQQSEDADNGRTHVLSARLAVAESERHQPAVAAYLPDDGEVRRWRRNHDQLLARLAEVQSEFDAMPDPEILRQSLIVAAQQIHTLELSQSNMLRKISGETGTWMDGGVSNVGGGNVASGKSWIR
jgi:hypothetical protein